MFGFSLRKILDDAVHDGENAVAVAINDSSAPAFPVHVSRLRNLISDALVRVPYYLPRNQELTVCNFWTRRSAAPVAASFGYIQLAQILLYIFFDSSYMFLHP
jgi:hypothetical protein